MCRPALREALTPNYRMGCKRILIADDYYPALTQSHVQLETTGISEVEAHGVRLHDGRRVALDALITATGFEAADIKPPCPVIGPQGRTLNATWSHGAQGYLGTMVAGYPNLFTIIGPNTGLGHNSMVFIIEAQLAFIDDAMRELKFHAWLSRHRRRAGALQRRAATGACRAPCGPRGCSSWYRRADGRITTLWPGSTLEYRHRTRRVPERDFEFALA